MFMQNNRYEFCKRASMSVFRLFLKVYVEYADIHVFAKCPLNQIEHHSVPSNLFYKSMQVYHDINILFLTALVILMNHRMHYSGRG